MTFTKQRCDRSKNGNKSKDTIGEPKNLKKTERIRFLNLRNRIFCKQGTENHSTFLPIILIEDHIT